MGKYVAYQIEQSCIRCRIAARRAPYGGLVNIYYLVQLVYAQYFVVFSGPRARAVKVPQQRFFQHLVHKAGFAAARYSRYAREHAKRYIHIHVFQIICPRPAYLQPVFAGFPPLCRHGDIFPAGKIFARYGLFIRHYLFRRAGKNNLAAVFARAWAYIHYVVRIEHCFLVVLNDYKRVAYVPHAL